MREVGWVIFDEIHYMRDKERGVVWEETLILLPDNVHYVFLSATIPNARQFAEWVTHLHKQPCHVVYTDYRPTPLQHYIFPVGSDGIHLVSVLLTTHKVRSIFKCGRKTCINLFIWQKIIVYAKLIFYKTQYAVQLIYYETGRGRNRSL